MRPHCFINDERRECVITFALLTDKFVANLALTTPFDPCGRVTLPQTTDVKTVHSVVLLSIGDVRISRWRNDCGYTS